MNCLYTYYVQDLYIALQQLHFISKNIYTSKNLKFEREVVQTKTFYRSARVDMVTKTRKEKIASDNNTQLARCRHGN